MYRKQRDEYVSYRVSRAESFQFSEQFTANYLTTLAFRFKSSGTWFTLCLLYCDGFLVPVLEQCLVIGMMALVVAFAGKSLLNSMLMVSWTVLPRCLVVAQVLPQDYCDCSSSPLARYWSLIACRGEWPFANCNKCCIRFFVLEANSGVHLVKVRPTSNKTQIVLCCLKQCPHNLF